MSSSDVEAGGQPRGSDENSTEMDPSQALAAGVFQMNTGVSTFKRIVNALGTPKDTPELREKLSETRRHLGQLAKDTGAVLKSASEADQQTDVTASKKVGDEKLAMDFKAVLKEFLEIQNVAEKREIAYNPFIQAAVQLRQPRQGQSSEIVLPKDVAVSKRFGDGKLAKDFRSLLKRFQKTQKVPATGETASDPLVPAAIESVGSSTNVVQLQPEDNEESRFIVADHQGLQYIAELDSEVDFNQAFIDEQERGIQDIRQQTVEVKEILKDLAIVVGDEGDIRASIDSNTGKAYYDAIQANRLPETPQKSNKTTLLIGIIVVQLLIIVILLIIIMVMAT